jgi:integrase
MALTDLEIRKLPVSEKQYKRHDAHGLYLLVLPSGGKSWRLKYRRDGKESVMSLGQWPTVSLAAARRQRDLIRGDLIQGHDPASRRREIRAETRRVALEPKKSFGCLATEWLAHIKPNLKQSSYEQRKRRIEIYVIPVLGSRDSADITTADVMSALIPIENADKIETAHRVRNLIEQIFDWAVARGRATTNPARGTAKGMRQKPVKHFAAARCPDQIGDILRATWDYPGSFSVQTLLRVMPYVAARPVEIRHWRWSEIDFDKAIWKRTLAKTRKLRDKRIMICPLAPQVLAEIELIRPYSFNRDDPDQFIFPGLIPGKPLSESTVGAALRRMGIDTRQEHTGHGWRGSFSTIAREAGAPRSWAEAQLGHVVEDETEAAYNAAEYLAQRKALMRWWANWLDAARLKQPAPLLSDYFGSREYALATGNVVPLAEAI